MSEPTAATGQGSGWLRTYSDGAARGNPGPAGIGGIAEDQYGRRLVEVCEYLGESTNNVAEYQALIVVLERSEGLGFDGVMILTDSELLANQVTGGFKVKSEALRPLADRVKALLAQYRRVEVKHIPREHNRQSDFLANRAIEEGMAGRKKPILEIDDEQLF